MKAYHGAKINKLQKLISAIESDSFGLYVTDTRERAARYANAQATGIVDPNATELGEHGAIVALEIPDNTKWMRRSCGSSLDEVETWIKHAEIISVEKVECDYLFCWCHGNLKEYSTSQAGKRIGLSEQRIRKLCSQGRIGRKIGCRWIIEHEDLMELARQLKKDSRSPIF